MIAVASMFIANIQATFVTFTYSWTCFLQVMTVDTSCVAKSFIFTFMAVPDTVTAELHVDAGSIMTTEFFRPTAVIYENTLKEFFY